MTEQEKKAMIDEMMRDKEGGGNRKFWSPPSKEEGTYRMRFLPPMKKNEEKKFYFDHKVHFIGGIPFECLNQSVEDTNGKFHEAETCPVCSYVKKLYSTSERDSDEWKLAGQLKARQRYVSRIILRSKEDPTQPEFYEYGPTVWKKLFYFIVESDFGNIIDPKDGRDFDLVKTGTGRNSNYDTSTPTANISPIFKTKEEIGKVLTNATGMKYNTLIEFKSYDDVKRALNEYLNIEEEDEALKTSKPKKSTPVVEEDESVEDIEDDEEVEADDDDISSILDEFTD